MSKTGDDNRAYAAAHFGMELDGTKQIGMFRSVEGGGVKADVMTYHHSINKESGYGRYRQLGRPKFDDIKLQVGMSMSQPFYEWLRDFFDGKPTRKNGAILAGDFQYKERARRNFSNAMIKELTFPKLEGQDKNPAYMNVALAVEDVQYQPGTGDDLAEAGDQNAQRLWTACNFRLSLDNFEGTRRCTKIDPFTIKQNIIEYHAGGFKTTQKLPTVVEFPNIVFYIPEADGEPFIKHMQKRVGFGSSGNGEVRDPNAIHGQIDVFDTDEKKNVVFTLEFYGADVVSVTPDKSDADSNEAKMVKVEIYTEKMTFNYPVLELE